MLAIHSRQRAIKASGNVRCPKPSGSNLDRGLYRRDRLFADLRCGDRSDGLWWTADSLFRGRGEAKADTEIAMSTCRQCREEPVCCERVLQQIAAQVFCQTGLYRMPPT